MEIEIPLTESEIIVEESTKEVIETFPAGVELVGYGLDESIDDEPHYIVRISDGNQFHRFNSERYARLWIDVWFDVGGFYESETGHRGVPPAIATAGTDTAISYLVTQFGTDEVVEDCSIKRTTLHQYMSRVRKRAREARAEFEDSTDASA